MVSDSSLTMDDVIMISLLFSILSDTLQFEFFASREKSWNWILLIPTFIKLCHCVNTSCLDVGN